MINKNYPTNTVRHLPLPSSYHTLVTPTIDPNTPSTGTNSLQDFLLSGKNQKCMFQSADDTEKMSMSKNNIAGTISGNNTKTVHIITDGEMAYIWVDGSTKGAQVPLSQTENINTIIGSLGLPGFDINAKKSYLCVRWTPDTTGTAFAAPGTITFSLYKK